MIGAGTRRGQPLLVLGLILAGWIGARALLWEGLALPIESPIGPPMGPLAAAPKTVPDAPLRPSPAVPITQRSAAPAMARPLPVPAAPLPQPDVAAPLPVFTSGGEPGPGGSTPRLAGGHQMAWIAGLAQLPTPQFLQGRPGPTDRTASLSPAIPPARAAGKAGNRWSVDGWLLLRQGGAAPVAGGLPSPTYGASQAGAVARYRLAPSSPHRPQLYLRVSSAIERPRGEEAALGLALRPLAKVPLVLTGEVRATRLDRATAVRPVLSLVTELEPVKLPLGTRAEVYAQGGYVGGSGATPFIDAQARIERRVATVGPVELRVGGGAWGGAQKGAGRIDVGPTATLDFPLAGGQGRIAADWRLRVAGKAAPQSGPALTLSAGF